MPQQFLHRADVVAGLEQVGGETVAQRVGADRLEQPHPARGAPERAANHLVGNPAGAAGLECALVGPELEFRQDALVAVCGAQMPALLDGREQRPDPAFAVRAGQVLRFGFPTAGARAYLAAPGGFDAPKVLGSCASVLREALGGLDGYGRALSEGGVLSYSGTGGALRSLSAAQLPDWQSAAPLEVILGAQIGQFSGLSLFDAFNSTWTLDSRADRMGARLLGPTLQYQGRPMISEGIPLGAIQVPPDGQPIILLNDRQTIGGYPRLGALTPLSLARLAQCLPGSEVRLTPVVQETAHRQQVAFLRRFG